MKIVKPQPFTFKGGKSRPVSRTDLRATRRTSECSEDI